MSHPDAPSAPSAPADSSAPSATSGPTVASSDGVVVLGVADLPAYCPNPQMPLWSSHPRVFLDLTEGRARCPYCGTEYRLIGGQAPAH